MPLTREQRTDAYRIYLMISERDMPSNNTASRLQQRSGIPIDRVQWALDFLWNDDAGFILMDEHRKTHAIGYYVDPKCRKKTAIDLDALFADWELAQEDLDEEESLEPPLDEDDDSSEDDEDSEWDEMDEEDEDDDG